MTPDSTIPYHLLCCTCDACLNGPVPYKLTGMGRTYATPQKRASRQGGRLLSVTSAGRKLEAEHRGYERDRADRRRKAAT